MCHANVVLASVCTAYSWKGAGPYQHPNLNQVENGEAAPAQRPRWPQVRTKSVLDALYAVDDAVMPVRCDRRMCLDLA